MKIKKIFEFYQSSDNYYRCPICHMDIKAEEPASIICKSGHCFNIAKEGYINFLPNQRLTKYRKQLFESRRIIFENGFYAPLAEELSNLTYGLSEKHHDFCIVDVGCGEGYYDCFLHEKIEKARLFAFDNMKEAVRMGAKACKKIQWFVGNLADIPIQSEMADMVLEIFAPSNYYEFGRIRKKDGYLLKVIPGNDYLQEIRNQIGLNNNIKRNNILPVEDYFKQNEKLIMRKHIYYKKEVHCNMADHFLEMTPLMFGRNSSGINKSTLKELTFDFVILLGVR